MARRVLSGAAKRGKKREMSFWGGMRPLRSGGESGVEHGREYSEGGWG
jgi:hypothetical protein